MVKLLLALCIMRYAWLRSGAKSLCREAVGRAIATPDIIGGNYSLQDHALHSASGLPLSVRSKIQDRCFSEHIDEEQLALMVRISPRYNKVIRWINSPNISNNALYPQQADWLEHMSSCDIRSCS
jgi:hypothetical protein